MTEGWIDVGALADIPRQGARTVERRGEPDIAVFRTVDDRVFALVNQCPHRQGPLSQGIVQGHAVTCPLHDWKISLATGQALGADKGCTPTIPIKLENGRIMLGIAVASKVAA